MGAPGARAARRAGWPRTRAELLHVLMLPDFDRVDRIGEFWGHPETREFGELLIDPGGGQGGTGGRLRLLAEMDRKKQTS